MTVLVFFVGVVVGAAAVVALVDRRMREPRSCQISPRPPDIQTAHGGGYWELRCTNCCWWNFWSSQTCVWVWVPGGNQH